MTFTFWDVVLMAAPWICFVVLFAAMFVGVVQDDNEHRKFMSDEAKEND